MYYRSMILKRTQVFLFILVYSCIALAAQEHAEIQYPDRPIELQQMESDDQSSTMKIPFDLPLTESTTMYVEEKPDKVETEVVDTEMEDITRRRFRSLFRFYC